MLLFPSQVLLNSEGSRYTTTFFNGLSSRVKFTRNDKSAARENTGEMFRSIVQQLPHRVICPPHQPFQSINSAQEMAFIYPLFTTRAYKKVFVVIGHADHFMGDNLSDGQYQIVSSLVNQFVQLGWPVIGKCIVRDLSHKFSGYPANGHNIIAPVVHPEYIPGYPREHDANLLLCHG